MTWISVLIGYLVITTILLIVVIWKLKPRAFIPIIVAAVVWYSIAFLMGIFSIAGTPMQTTLEKLPEDSVILWAEAVEPSNGDNGNIFFLLGIAGGPKLFSIPYDKSLHKKLAEAKKKITRLGDYLILKGKKGKKGALHHGSDATNVHEDDSPFSVKNPFSEMTKDD